MAGLQRRCQRSTAHWKSGAPPTDIHDTEPRGRSSVSEVHRDAKTGRGEAAHPIPEKALDLLRLALENKVRNGQLGRGELNA